MEKPSNTFLAVTTLVAALSSQDAEAGYKSAYDRDPSTEEVAQSTDYSKAKFTIDGKTVAQETVDLVQKCLIDHLPESAQSTAESLRDTSNVEFWTALNDATNKTLLNYSKHNNRWQMSSSERDCGVGFVIQYEE